MKLHVIRIAVFAVAFTVSTPLIALDTTEYLAEVHYPLGNAKEFELHSAKTGRKYKILITLPGSYATSGEETRYPVLYTVDGQWYFSIAGSVMGGLYYDRGARETIVVGITWDGDEASANRLRVEDFTPTNTDFAAGSGKADSYLDFLQYELIPYMARNYRTSEDRTLSGVSFGGLFTLYCLFTRPAVFTDYLASTPSVWWDDGILRKYRESFLKTTLPSPVRLYVARGEMEYGRHEIDVFVNELKAAGHHNLEIEFDVIRGAGHGGLNPEVFTRGMQFIFKKQRIKIDEKQLASYTGTYKDPSGGPDIEIRPIDGKLHSMEPQTRTMLQLVAVDENLFYVANTGAEVSFATGENERVTHMNFKRDSGELKFEKIMMGSE
jgi:predicted alpha/beta superfamily hydrolase